MRVLHVIPAVAARYGGPSQAIFAMCRALKVHGAASLIATTDADGPSRLPVEVARPIMYQNTPSIFFPRQWSEGFKYSYPLARWLAVNVSQYDLVHIAAVFSHTSLAAARACQRHIVPYIVRPLGSLAPWCMRQKRLQKRLLWRLGVQPMLRQAAAIHYTTHAESRQAEQSLGLQQGVVIPLGVNEDLLDAPDVAHCFRHHYPALGQSPYILVLSRLHPVKRLEYLLQAFLEVLAQAPFQAWRLVVAGDGEKSYVRYLQKLVSARGKNESVLFTGWLDTSMKTAALQGAALLAQPSQSENFGLSIAEALACETPVLVSTQVNLADDICAAKAGWVVPLHQAAIRRALEDALSHKSERVARGRAGRNLVYSQFRWSVVAKKLIQLYDKVTS